MAELRPGRPDPGDAPVPPTVLITAPDRRRRRALSDQLVDSGMRVLGCASWTAALEVIAQETVDLGIVDSGVTDYYTEPSPVDLGYAARGALPLLFLVASPLEFDWDAYSQLDQAEVSTADIRSPELALRVCALANRIRRQSDERQAEDKMRSAVRRTSAAIRASNDPVEVVETLVDRLVQMFGADLVAFTTFEDDRVPAVAVQWGSDPGRIVAVDTTAHRPAQRALANRLWAAGTTMPFSDHVAPPLNTEVGALYTWAKTLGARASISVPVGNGHDAVGIIWMGLYRPKTWTAVETGSLQLLASNVSHQLMQGQVITGQQEVLRRLGRLDRAKNEFLATVNHELRTPLTSLSAYLDLVREGSGGPIPPRAAEMLTVVDRSARRLTGLVDDILTVSRIVASDPDMTWSPVDLVALTRSVVNKLRPAATAEGIELSATLPERLLVDGDIVHLKQVLLQLTDNALKFTDPGGRVEVRLTELEVRGIPKVQLCVSDTGVGIDHEEVPELFNRFFRGSNAQATAASGSGLGLTIVSGLVEAHHGEVTVESKPGGGTCVCVLLPQNRAEVPDRFLPLRARRDSEEPSSTP